MGRTYILKSATIVSAVTCLIFLSGCAEKRDWADVGYSDGYASGYNTTCEIRTTLIEGKFEKKEYKSAYDRGYLDGSNACKKERGDSTEW